MAQMAHKLAESLAVSVQQAFTLELHHSGHPHLQCCVLYHGHVLPIAMPLPSMQQMLM
jgi:hypothetical protein